MIQGRGDCIKKLIFSSNMFLAGVMFICTVLILNRPDTGWMFLIGLVLVIVGLIAFIFADTKK
jgi:hypothetical protein